jgi:hypothetical protein
VSKTVADLEDFIALFAQDAPSAVLQHALREGIVRFMRESQIFQDELEITTECLVRDYPLALPECQQLVSVESVEFGQGCREHPAFVTGAKFWNWHRDSMEDVIVLTHAPRAASKLTVKYAWAIARDECELPRHLYEQWMEAVKHAALAELFAMPKQEWTDIGLANRSEGIYAVELIKAKNRRWSNYSRGPIKMVGSTFLSRR